MSHRAIFINGIPSSGKSSMAAELFRRVPSFEVIEGDEIIRQVPTMEERLKRHEQLFQLTLDLIQRRLERGHVIVDGAWSGAQVEVAKGRFEGLFVVLRIDEQERLRREAKRRDRQLAHWRQEFHEMPGPDELYDLVIDTREISPATCADLVLAAVNERWPEGS